MDTTKQNPVNQPVDTAAPVVSQPVATPPIQATSSTSIGPGNEGEPIRTKAVAEYTSTPEVKLHPEVAAAGVEAVNDETVTVPEEAAAVGVTPAKEATPLVADHPKWPMTPQKANTILTAPHIVIKNSVVWLATVIKKMMKKEALQPVKEEENVPDVA